LVLVALLCTTACHNHPEPSETVKSMRSDILVTPEQLSNLMKSEPVIIVAKVGYGKPSGSFIPGSIYVNTDEIEYDEFSPRSSTKNLDRTTSEAQDLAKGLTSADSLPKNWWNLYPDDLLLKALAHMGITTSSKIVVYGDTPEPAARMFWCLKYTGVDEVYFLNGGTEAWTDARYQISDRPAERKPAELFGISEPANPQYRATTEFVRDIVQNSDNQSLIIDTRSHKEHIGEFTPYSYLTEKGRIKKSIFGGSPDSSVSMTNYYSEDHLLRPLDQIASTWREQGITSDDTLHFYCGTGWRSSVAWLCAYAMGAENIANYDGSWYDWSMGREKEMNLTER
jgi:3-mercaptopyruvate sulfurtransferase SseA